MAQQSGLMNTAPSPIPGGYGNPTGANTGLPTASPLAVPPAYGAVPVGAVPAPGGPNSGVNFPANGVTGTSGTTANPALTNLSSGFGSSTISPDVLKQLDNDYGKGVGGMIAQMLSQGLFNPQVASALIAAMQPQINRGLSATESAFGAEGARFSSSAQIGVGDYESQAVLGENQVLANMYLTDQQEQLSLLENILPTVNKEQDNSQNGLLSTLSDIFAFGSLGPGFAQAAAKGNESSSSTVPVISPTGGSTGTGAIPGSAPAGALQDLNTLNLETTAGADLGGASGASSGMDIEALLAAFGG